MTHLGPHANGRGVVGTVSHIIQGEMESVAINAGKLVGLGNGRLIGFGRFDIEAFEMQE